MRTLIPLLLAAVLATEAGAAAGTAASHAARVAGVTLAVRHRVFQNFEGHYQVRLNQEFPVGDTEYSARVVRYVPDFAMDLDTHKVFSRSNEPKNPAFQIVVRQKKVPRDTTWAMLRMPPHFARNSMLAFKIERIDFVGRAPLLRSDSLEARR